MRTERFRTLVILDEMHHAGEALSWGEASAKRSTGDAPALADGNAVPLRHHPIPFVAYAQDRDGIRRSADYTYGYRNALPTMWSVRSCSWPTPARCGGAPAPATRWRLAGRAADQGQDLAGLRTALDPAGEWVPAVLAAADRRLSEVRRHVPDAGGLVIATDQDYARAYAGQLEGSPAKSRPSSFPTRRHPARSRNSVRAKSAGWSPSAWCPKAWTCPGLRGRLRDVDVHAALLRAGRGPIRACPEAGRDGLRVPASVPQLLALAAAMELNGTTRSAGRTGRGRPVRRRGRADGAGQAGGTASDSTKASSRPCRRHRSTGCCSTAASSAPGATSDRQDEELDFLGIPGLLDAEQVRDLLGHRQSERMKEKRRARRRTAHEPSAHQRLAALRKELNGMVATWRHRSRTPHGIIHAELRRTCGGPPAAVASGEELQQRIDTLRLWASTRRRS